MLRPALFLDRDGVIVENRADYIKSLAEVTFLPGALTALAALARRDWPIIVVTNQSAVGRRVITLGRALAINAYVSRQIVQAGGRVDGLYLCPHHPDEGCPCRKPRPGMLLRAAQALGLDLPRSIMIGDAVTDVQAGQAAGAQVRLVRTGRGQAQQVKLTRAGLSDVACYAHLAEALADLL